MSERCSIYIHVPFCLKKCRYCDFYSVTDTRLVDLYTESVVTEVRKRAVHDPCVETLYFGGGTPSLLPLSCIEQVLAALDNSFDMVKAVEKTIEINPGTVDESYIRGLKALGFNRVSIGVQSFDDHKLRVLGRIHTADQALKTIESVQKAGIDQISLDMIYALADETLQDWQKDLEKAIDTDVSHLSCYMLTIEPGTPLFEDVISNKICFPKHQDRTQFFKLTSGILTSSGFDHYEISNFSKDRSTRSRHNSNYWNMTPYFGFGPSAHSYDGSGCRSFNYKDLERYIRHLSQNRLPVAQTEVLSEKQKMLEMVMVRLRTREGIHKKRFYKMFKERLEERFSGLMQQLEAASLAKEDQERFYLHLEGMVRLDHILEAFAEKIL